MEAVFWLSALAVVYPYVLYPGLLRLLGAADRIPAADGRLPLPSVTMVIPVSNEASRIVAKIANTEALTFPRERLQVIYVSDGSTDRTVELIRANAAPGTVLIDLPLRRGKAAGLNAGLAKATGEIVVFSDASIELEPEALEHIVRPFHDPRVGCVSGEDRIEGHGGEAWYGRYELFLRRLEANVHSIAGASGSFYAQRRHLCSDFAAGMAPDFLSVLRTVEQGARAISEPSAVGRMTSLKDPKREFERKVRTILRGITTLAAYARLMNPLRSGWFAVILISHKLLRWTAPVFLLLLLLIPLTRLDSPFFTAVFLLQLLAYAAAAAALAGYGPVGNSLAGRGALYFASVNVAALMAWIQYSRGVRQEVWTPTDRGPR